MRRIALTLAAFCLTVVLGSSQSMATTLNLTVGARLFHQDPPFSIQAITPYLLTGQIQADFVSAFNSWNADMGARGGQGMWTLVNGGALANTTIFDISTYRATQNGATGDLEIQIDYTPGAGPPAITNAAAIGAGDAVWSQSVYTTDKLAGALAGNPYLDNPAGLAGTQLGPPAYPFQYDGTNGKPASTFYDDPARDSVNQWFADAYISTADYTNHVLTVYDGVRYGFTVVPEPSSVILSGIGGLLLVGIARRRRRTAA